jgi:hypothetical protein
MDYHFIQMKPTKAFLSIVDPNKKSRFVCFSDKKTAEVFVNYVTTFRSKHGFWPNLDMSREVRTVKSKVGFKQRSPDELREYISLDAYDYETIYNMARRTNVSFICVTDFASSPDGEHQQRVSFSGQEWDGEADEAVYRDLLEFKLKCE